MANTTSSVAELLNNTKTLNTNSDSVITLNTNSELHRTKSVSQVRMTAQRISDKLNNPSRFNYYCKVAWKLPESKIFTNLEQSLTGKDPARYFSFLCSLDMRDCESER